MLLAMSVLTVMLTGVIRPADVRCETRQDRVDNEYVATAIKGLWSPHEVERSRAIADLIKLNDKAVPALLGLLEDIKRNPQGPRFPTGKEEEGSLAWERFQKSPNNSIKDITRLEITSRLEKDAIDIVGELRARVAVPLLIEIMAHRMKDNWIRPRWSAEMLALQKIGQPAIPLLVDLIEAQFPPVRFGSSVTPEEAAIFSKSIESTAKTRAVMVLGEIGDKEALPALERLLKRCAAEELVCPDDKFIMEAIKNIQAKR